MRVTVSLSLSEPFENCPESRVVVAIDVLRASTTIVTAIGNGCTEIVPVASVDDAWAAFRSRPDALLCGERKGKRIDGFDLGNSPLEYTSEAVNGRSLILTTTNGTVLLERHRKCERVIGCFANLYSVIRHLTSSCGIRDVHLACAGKLNRPGLEDIACAGAMVSLIQRRCSEIDCDDGALTAAAVWQRFDGSASEAVSSGTHARYLRSIGFGSDVVFCSRAGDGSVPRMPAGAEALSLSSSEGGVC